MAKEHRCETPDGHRLCANNCGFFGSSATMNLCSKCYGAIRLKEQDTSTKSTIETAVTSSAKTPLSTMPPVAINVLLEELPPPPLPEEAAVAVPVQLAVVSSFSSSGSAQSNQCAACRKRVGLTGFKCRCRVTFCGTHIFWFGFAGLVMVESGSFSDCSWSVRRLKREEIECCNYSFLGKKYGKGLKYGFFGALPSWCLIVPMMPHIIFKK